MKEMTFVSLINILISSIEDDSQTTRKANQNDIDRLFG